MVAVALLQATDFHTLFLVVALTSLIAAIPVAAIRSSVDRRDALRDRVVPLIHRKAIFPAVLGMTMSLTYGTVISFVPLHASRQGVNSGVFFMAHALSTILARVVAGQVSDRLGRAAVMAPGYVLLAAALLILAVGQTTEAFVLAGIVYGLGFGATHPTLLALVTDVTEPGERGAAIGTVIGALDLALMIGSMALGVVLYYGGFSTLFVVSTASPMLGLGLLLAQQRRLRATLS